MNKYFRLLVMFGPMIYKGVTKFMASRKQNQATPTAPQNEDEIVDEQ